MPTDANGPDRPLIAGWYKLFSRGARDWLRHSEKIRAAVREHLVSEASALPVWYPVLARRRLLRYADLHEVRERIPSHGRATRRYARLEAR